MRVKDKFLAFQLDSALAVKFDKEDRELDYKMLENVNKHILLVCKGLGMKISQSKKRETKVPDGELPSLEEMLVVLGGNGTVIEK